jgi:DNA replication ATP-dependent helicase Dna2
VHLSSEKIFSVGARAKKTVPALLTIAASCPTLPSNGTTIYFLTAANNTTKKVGSTIMTTTETQEQVPNQTTHSCFLCLIDHGQHCHTPYLKGQIVKTGERSIDGIKTALLLLDIGTEQIELRLDGNYYKNLVYELNARKEALSKHNLTMHVYHLPQAPSTVEHNGSSRPCYTGNAYTLAVIEPDILLNITDLNQAEYCTRQYLLNRLTPGTISLATIRGNLIHYCFKELLKAHDRGQIPYTNTKDGQDNTPFTAQTHLETSLEQALQINAIDLALTDIPLQEMRDEVMPHLVSLAQWFECERTTLWDKPLDLTESGPESETVSGNQVRAETFLLAPEIGLRGRLDLFWQQLGRQRLLELKTSTSPPSARLPKSEHRWQVHGYHALLAVRRESHMKRALAILLYSGTPGSAQAHGIRSTMRELQRVNERRNILILNRITGIPFAPPGPGRCTKCSMLTRCQQISALLQWEPPKPDEEAMIRYRHQQALQQGQDSKKNDPLLPGEDERTFFVHYYRLLQLEGHAGEEQQALLWKLPVTERVERGMTIVGLQQCSQPVVSKDGWELTFHCINTSELREGDEILLSDGNPITGEVVSGAILHVSSQQVTVWTREHIAHPQMIDRYDNDLVHVRTLQNLFRWLQVGMHQRDLVAGRVQPRFMDVTVTPRPDFNAEQNLAVERAIQMQDYLLIHGPPGTGKTGVIAEIVQHLVKRGQRVLLSAFTNQAVDNMLIRLEAEGFDDYLRLGSERSVTPSVRAHLLKELAAMKSAMPIEEKDGIALAGDLILSILHTTRVVASTTATWSSDKYSAQSAYNDGELLDQNNLHFDVAIIDEAGQLTVPAILGALRFARRFILVGDEKQLPPLVLNPEAAEQGLSQSLFAQLKRLDEIYTSNHQPVISACVALQTQYRMNKWIANFSSTVFYNKKLHSHPSIANKQLVYPRPTAEPINERSLISATLEPKFPLVFLDVREEESDTGEQKQSNAEAHVICEVVAGLLARGIALQDIGIIAPFRAQVANIRRYLFTSDQASGWQALPADAPITVDTVDRFQGGERLVILLSFATQRSLPANSLRREFLTNPHRLNVALTRAQRKLILVGNTSILENLPILQRLITYCRSMRTLMTPQQGDSHLSAEEYTP